MIDMLSEDEFLEHFGKKGMKWGVRTDSRETQIRNRLDKLEKVPEKFSRKLISADAILAGAAARANAAKKVLNLSEEKALDGSARLVSTDKSVVVTDANRAAIGRKINRVAYAKFGGTGAVAVAGILATTAVASAKVKDPAMASRIVAGGLFLAGAQTLMTASTVRGIHRVGQDENRWLETKALRKELRVITKTSNSKVSP